MLIFTMFTQVTFLDTAEWTIVARKRFLASMSEDMPA